MAIQLQYLEKDIEDLLEEDCEHYLGLKFICRQFRTPVGIIDVIAKHPEMGTYYVIEIKQGRLTPAAYVQVIRYAKWLNSEESKNGKRLFIPLVVGRSLDDELKTICELFDKNNHHSVENVNEVSYRLFNLDPKNGVFFNCQDRAERVHRNSLVHHYNHVYNLKILARAHELVGDHMDKYIRELGIRIKNSNDNSIPPLSLIVRSAGNS